jgi:hypothetical protein
MEFSFFTTDNKSGYKSTEKWFSKNYAEEYNKIIQHSVEYNIGDTFKEKIWVYFNNLTQRPKCLTCNGEIKFNNRFDRNGYGDFCSVNCMNNNLEEMNKRIKESNNKKYGVDYYPEHKDFISKQKNTKKEKYGDENYNHPLKSRTTKLEKYGDENYNNPLKGKITSLKLYGVDNPSKNKDIIKKIIDTNNNLYGYNSPLLNIKIKEKKYNTIINKLKNKIGVDFIKYDFNKSEYTLNCKKCNNNYSIHIPLFNERYRNKQETCIGCNPIGSGSSGLEKNIKDFLISLNINNIIFNDTKILNGKEIDIYLPDYNIGIEFNGVYWHSDLFKTNDYHLNKTKLANDKGIKLIHIFEDEWVYKQEIVKSRLLNLLKKTPNKVYARKCIIKEITNNECKEFLINNHIQGNVYSRYKVGLFFNDELVSLMTFGGVRTIMSGKNTLPGYELSRFCNKLNTNVIGSASKLYKYFIEKYKPNRIISYADARWSGLNPENTLYVTLGFTYKHTSKPNYWYVKNELRYHRSNFTKQSLIKKGFDLNKTEKEIMSERNYNRIYDCGHLVYEKLF